MNFTLCVESPIQILHEKMNGQLHPVARILSSQQEKWTEMWKQSKSNFSIKMYCQNWYFTVLGKIISQVNFSSWLGDTTSFFTVLLSCWAWQCKYLKSCNLSSKHLIQSYNFQSLFLICDYFLKNVFERLKQIPSSLQPPLPPTFVYISLNSFCHISIIFVEG